MRDRRRAVHAGDDGEIISRADAAIWTSEAVEGTHLFRRIKLHRPRIRTEGVVATEIAHHHVVRVNVVSGANHRRREADGLAVLGDGLPFPDVLQRNLVSCADGLPDVQRASATQLVARLHGALEHGHVVALAQDDGALVEKSFGHARKLKTPRCQVKPSPEGRSSWMSSAARSCLTSSQKEKARDG